MEIVILFIVVNWRVRKENDLEEIPYRPQTVHTGKKSYKGSKNTAKCSVKPWTSHKLV